MNAAAGTRDRAAGWSPVLGSSQQKRCEGTQGKHRPASAELHVQLLAQCSHVPYAVSSSMEYYSLSLVEKSHEYF